MALAGIGSLIGGAASLGGLISSLFGGGGNTSGLEDAMDTKNNLDMIALSLAMQQYAQGREDLDPYRRGGTSAELALYDLLGLARPTPQEIAPELYVNNTPEQVEYLLRTGKTPPGWTNVDNATQLLNRVRPYITTPTYDPTALLESTPGYQFRVQQSENALDKYLASKGMSLSGPAVKAAEENRQGLASQEYQNLVNRIENMRNSGQNAATGTVQAGNQATGTAVNALMTSGQQGVQNEALLNQLNTSSYNSPWGWIGYGANKFGNALDQILKGSSSNNNLFSDFQWPVPEIQG